MRSSFVGLGLAVFAFACGGTSTSAPQAQVVLCPAGSVLDPQKNQCVAMEGVQPVVPEVAAPLATALPAPTASVSVSVAASVPVAASASVSVPASASVSASAPVPPPPPASGFAVDVRCTFSSGWVSLLPAGKYPKDDQFLMQSLIGLTKEPSFWSGTEYRSLQPFAAKRCTSSGFTRFIAPAAGSYFLLAGEEGTFSARGTYDKNGVRRQMTVNASTSVTLAPTDLTHTWLCISCPWIVFRGDGGRDLEPFVVLANRRGVGMRGTDSHRTTHVRVENGRIALRVMEVENETTHLEKLVLRFGDHEISPDKMSRELRLDRDKQSTLTFTVPNVESGHIDVDVIATGYYDPW